MGLFDSGFVASNPVRADFAATCAPIELFPPSPADLRPPASRPAPSYAPCGARLRKNRATPLVRWPLPPMRAVGTTAPSSRSALGTVSPAHSAMPHVEWAWHNQVRVSLYLHRHPQSVPRSRTFPCDRCTRETNAWLAPPVDLLGSHHQVSKSCQ